MDRLQLALDGLGSELHGELMQSEPEVLGSEEFATFAVALEHLTLLAGEGSIEDVEVGFIVDEEGAIVEVGGSDRGKVIVHDEEFAVHHGGRVFPNLASSAVELEQGRALCDAADLEVGVLSADDDLDVDTALASTQEGVHEVAVGDEVGMLNED